MSDQRQVNPEAIKAKEKGNEFYKKKQFEEALKCYDEAINLDPNEISFYNNRAAVYYEQKDYNKCIQECEKAVEIGRENRADFKLIAKALSRLASSHNQLGDLKQAQFYYQKSLTEHRIPETLTKLSAVEKSLKEIERKEYINPELSLEEKKKGNEEFSKGNYPVALKHYTEAIKRNPDDAKIYSNRAACYQKLAEFHLALKDCEECLKLDPTFVKGYIRKGMALLAMKESVKARTAFQRALELEPNSSEALEGYRKCSIDFHSNQEDVRNQAMSDPEVQSIISDPAMRVILQQMSTDPKAAQEHLKDPVVAGKIQKLIESGIVKIR